MAIKTHDFKDFDEFSDLDNIYGYMGGNRLYDTYDSYNQKQPAGFVFDPKNPPLFGCTSYHPPLQLNVNDKSVEIFGSSCLNPNIKDADIYISLDSMADDFLWERPWEKNGKEHIRFFIKDGGVPTNINQFTKCLDYTIAALAQGKKVHVGCIAGHGRTGVFLAALAQKTIGTKLENEYTSAIDYVRDTYCNNAVENMRQVLFLHAVYDVAIPRAEKKRFNDFEKLFLEEIGVGLKEVIEKTDFNKVLPLILDIDRKLTAIYNPPKISPITPKYPGTNTIIPTTAMSNASTIPTTLNPQGLPKESNGTIAMGTSPEVSNHFKVDNSLKNNAIAKSFINRLDPEKLAKLEAFKLRRMK